MVYAADLKSAVLGHAGSTPVSPTNIQGATMSKSKVKATHKKVREFIGKDGRTLDELFEEFNVNVKAKSAVEELTDIPRMLLFLIMRDLIQNGEISCDWNKDRFSLV